MRAVLFLIPFAGLLQASTIYSITDLGALGGGSTVAFGISSSGIAVGWGQTPTGDQSAFVSGSGGSMQHLAGLAGASDTYAYGINAAGTAVGTSYVNGQPHGEIWNGAKSTDLGAGVFATGINDSGVVIGGNGHAFVLVNGTYRDLGVLPGGGWSAAQGINKAGTVVGYGSIGNGMFRGFIWTPTAGMTGLGTFGGHNSYATAINGKGEVVGHAAMSNGYEHAFLEAGAGMTDLGTLGGGNSYAYGINDSGTIVGYSWLTGNQDQRAFVYLNGVMLDLNALIPSGLGWELLGAYGINSAGQIVGEGMRNGQSHAFRLDPQLGFSAQGLGMQAVPDPGTEWLVGIGVGLICLRRGRTGHSAPGRI